VPTFGHGFLAHGWKLPPYRELKPIGDAVRAASRYSTDAALRLWGVAGSAYFKRRPSFAQLAGPPLPSSIAASLRSAATNS
jgi:hypothetical protein